MQAIDILAVAPDIPCGYILATMTVGENVQRVRKLLKLSQIDLANRLGMRQPSIWKIEHGKGLPEAATLLKLAKALTCSVEELLVGVDADYDAVIARAEQVQAIVEKKNGSVTTPVIEDGVQRASTIYTPARTAEPGGPQLPTDTGEVPLGAQARVRELETSYAVQRLRLLKQILDATDSIRAAVDGLGTQPDPRNASGEQPEHTTRHRNLPRRAARRRGGRS